MLLLGLLSFLIWRTRYKCELYTIYDEPDIVKVVNIGRGVWDTSLECKNWILADSLLYLNQNVPDL
jgi:hypothetical protein